MAAVLHECHKMNAINAHVLFSMNATHLTCGKLVHHALSANKLASRSGNGNCCEDPSATFTDCNHPTADILTVCLVGAFSLRFCTMVNHHFSPPFVEYACFFPTTKQANLSGESTSRWLKKDFLRKMLHPPESILMMIPILTCR